MNWNGGAISKIRNRKDDLMKQNAFFEKKKLSSLKNAHISVSRANVTDQVLSIPYEHVKAKNNSHRYQRNNPESIILNDVNREIKYKNPGNSKCSKQEFNMKSEIVLPSHQSTPIVDFKGKSAANTSIIYSPFTIGDTAERSFGSKYIDMDHKHKQSTLMQSVKKEATILPGDTGSIQNPQQEIQEANEGNFIKNSQQKYPVYAPATHHAENHNMANDALKLKPRFKEESPYKEYEFVQSVNTTKYLNSDCEDFEHSEEISSFADDLSPPPSVKSLSVSTISPMSMRSCESSASKFDVTTMLLPSNPNSPLIQFHPGMAAKRCLSFTEENNSNIVHQTNSNMHADGSTITSPQWKPVIPNNLNNTIIGSKNQFLSDQLETHCFPICANSGSDSYIENQNKTLDQNHVSKSPKTWEQQKAKPCLVDAATSPIQWPRKNSSTSPLRHGRSLSCPDIVVNGSS